MNDRHRVELLLPLYAIQDIVLNATSDPSGEERPELLQLLQAAIALLQRGRTDAEAAKLAARVKRAHDLGLSHFARQGSRMDIYGYGLYYVLRVLTESEYLVIGDDDPIRAVVSKFLPVLAESPLNAHETTSAKSQGRAMLQTYQALGLYRGVEWPDRLDD